MPAAAVAGDFDAALDACRREASAAFGNDAVLLERCIDAPRHIEVQVFADTLGNVVHLFERDCSLQRRHQKILEESPAPGMDPATRAALCATAVTAARSIGYVGAGTVEFIADATQGLRADRIWFMEMNTRLQVEHPVTERVTGEDLVEWQLRIAAGEPLPRRQEELRLNGWAMEARLYAEDPRRDFLPSTGPLRHLRLPDDIRVDTGVEAGDEVSGFYDALLAKLVVHAPDRAAAADRLARACESVEVWPVRCNAALLAAIARHPEFIAAAVDTGFIARHAAALLARPELTAPLVRVAALALLPRDCIDPWDALTGWRGSAPPYRQIAVDLDGECHVATPGPAAGARVVDIDGERILFAQGMAWRCQAPRVSRTASAAAGSDGLLRAPMPGRIVSVPVGPGARVVSGQRLVALEAMKMEHSLAAPFDGVVAAVSVAVGDQVSEGTVLVQVRRQEAG